MTPMEEWPRNDLSQYSARIIGAKLILANYPQCRLVAHGSLCLFTSGSLPLQTL